jgi:hypothetical protein
MRTGCFASWRRRLAPAMRMPRIRGTRASADAAGPLTWPAPQPGLVIRYSYLWHGEAPRSATATGSSGSVGRARSLNRQQRYRSTGRAGSCYAAAASWRIATAGASLNVWIK